MKNNLTPTVVTDKNGKLTTVHKKQDTGPNATTSIPAPVGVPSNKANAAGNGIEEYDSEVGSKLYALMEAEVGNRKMGMDKMVLVVRANNRQRALYLELMERKDGFWGLMNAATSSSLPNGERPGDEEFESMALLYDKDLFESFPDAPKLSKAQKQYAKLRDYRKALYELWKEPALTLISTRKEAYRLGTLPSEAVEEARGYLKLKAAVDDSCPPSDELLGDLLDVALHSGDHSLDDVIRVVREHHTRDTNTVLGILNGATTSVAEGWL